MLPVLHHGSALMNGDGSGERCPPNIIFLIQVPLGVSNSGSLKSESSTGMVSVLAGEVWQQKPNPRLPLLWLSDVLTRRSQDLPFPSKAHQCLTTGLGESWPNETLLGPFPVPASPDSRHSRMKLQHYGHHHGFCFVWAPCQHLSYEIPWIPRSVILRNI